jgi:hypothetical protein
MSGQLFLAPCALIVGGCLLLRQRRLAMVISPPPVSASADEDEDTFVWPADDLVMPLTLSSFDRHVGNGSTWMVEFYAPWCKHCQALQPVLEASARELLEDLWQQRAESERVCFGKVCASNTTARPSAAAAAAAPSVLPRPTCTPACRRRLHPGASAATGFELYRADSVQILPRRSLTRAGC